LVLEAPGTYHHSVIIGNLAEAAAEAIGANPLLVRVASYYHDIGKIVKPEYFTENDTGRSRHDNISPSISALIIMAHVKDGVEMGHAYKLPQDILDIMEQHHGDSVISYFYQRAQEMSEDPGEVSKGAFRYPGPKPQTREAAILLLADCVEAASRSLSEPTPAHIKELVHRIVNGRLMEHQLDDSPLTFRDISTIEASFVRTLTAMYHSRVPYQEQKNGTKRVRR
ncbi:MAG: HDIG domain-containing protein, partial [Planctomycetes bacterium]|nr:HDIG domain-containing protein [Planctomycetota bacterium]